MDTVNDWSVQRSRVYSGGRRHLVILGASCIQLGFDTKTFSQLHPDYGLSQLAVNGGKSALPVLRDLADDTEFRGIVLCSIHERWFPAENWREHEQRIKLYRQSNPVTTTIEHSLSTLCPTLAVRSNHQLRIDRVVHSLASGKSISPPPYFRIMPDRSIRADYTQTDIDERRRDALSRRAPDERGQGSGQRNTQENIPQVDEWVRNIRRRGGDVVFVKLPVSKELAPLADQRTQPGSLWACFAASTSAHVINCRDDSRFDSLPFSDPTHLDYRHAPEFTRDLLAVLVDRGVLERLEP